MEKVVKEVILCEDDCAPDAYEDFCASFKVIFGLTFDEWKKCATRVPTEDDEFKLQFGSVIAWQSAYEPYWTVYKFN